MFYKRLFYSVLFLIMTLHGNAGQISGLSINIYLKITGLWDDPKSDTDLENCYKCGLHEFGWGKSRSWVNSFTIIDPTDNNFQFRGLHSLPFKSIKEVESNIFDIELYFMQGNIQRYRIKVIKDGFLEIVDNGSTEKYVVLNREFKRVGGPDFKIDNYGYINGKSVRIREKFGLNAKIEGLIL